MIPLIELFRTEGLILILLAILIILILVIIDRRKNRQEEVAKMQSMTMEDILSQYGEPDNIVVVNPTHGNESEGTVLEYKAHKLLFVKGEPIGKAHIKDVSFNNYAMALLANEYMIIILTDLPGKSVIRLPLGAGNDARYAEQVVQDIRALL